MKQQVRNYIYGYLLLSPALLVLIFVIIIPLTEATAYSFTSTNLLNFKVHEYIGLKNYRLLLANPDYWVVFRNTIFIVFTSVALALLLGFIVALIMDKFSSNIIRGFIIIPWLIPNVVVGIILKWVFATDAGVFNYLLRELGIIESNFPFLVDKVVTPWIVVFAFIWSSTPYIIVTTLAALKAVPNDLVEAAYIDGANYMQRLFAVVIPVILPVISIAIVLRIIYTMQNFAIIFALTEGGPGMATETFVLFVYKTAFNSTKIGMACTIGVTWLVFLLVFIIVYFKLMGVTKDRVL